MVCYLLFVLWQVRCISSEFECLLEPGGFKMVHCWNCQILPKTFHNSLDNGASSQDHKNESQPSCSWFHCFDDIQYRPPWAHPSNCSPFSLYTWTFLPLLGILCLSLAEGQWLQIRTLLCLRLNLSDDWWKICNILIEVHKHSWD
jgi:hypothetical protein